MDLAQRVKIAVATDLVVLRAPPDGGVELLLVKRKSAPYRNRWALPGGFLEEGEDLRDCARRELFEETGLRPKLLEQLRAFFAPGRDPRGPVLSVAYLAFVAFEASDERAGGDAQETKWRSVEDVPRLAFDHDEIAGCAFEYVSEHLFMSERVFRLMPDEFTISEARAVFEVFSSEPIDRRNFHKWFMASSPAVQVGRTRGGAHRPAQLFRLKHGEG